MDHHRARRLTPAVAVAGAVAVVVMAAVMVAEAQMPSCASKLVSCADYLNSTKPPPACCNPLREAVEKELACLCQLYNTPGLLSTFHINLTQVLLLPRHCNISGGTDACNKSSASPPKSSASSLPPPPGGPVAKDSNEAGRIAGGATFALLLLWICTMIY